MITLPCTADTSSARAAIAARLEQEYETHSEHLISLLASSRRHRRMGAVRAAAHAEAVAVTRRAIADVAQALRRLAEGTYGLCERCLCDIPQGDLEINPAARRCAACKAGPMF